MKFPTNLKSWEISSVFVFQLETVCPQSVTVQYSKASLHHLSQTTPVFIRVPGPKLVFHPSHFTSALFSLDNCFLPEYFTSKFTSYQSTPTNWIKLLDFLQILLIWEKVIFISPWKKRSWYCSRHYVILGLSNGWRRWISLVCSS